MAALPLETLYADHHGWLQHWLRRRLGNSADAADLAHDTFLRILAARQSTRIEEPRRYLATVARGLVIDRYRRQAIETAYLQALAGCPEPVVPSPEAHELILETLQEIDRVLDELGPRTRQIFMLSQFEQLTQPEIGRRLGVSVTTVRKHMIRALTRCLMLLEE